MGEAGGINAPPRPFLAPSSFCLLLPLVTLNQKQGAGSPPGQPPSPAPWDTELGGRAGRDGLRESLEHPVHQEYVWGLPRGCSDLNPKV